MVTMQFDRRGFGPPLLLVHGLGGNRHSFDSITDDLALEREIIAPDLPGFGQTPPLDGPVTIATLADALEAFLDEHDLDGIDCVGTSMGARLVLELARRKRVGATVALDPGGFWSDREVRVFGASISTSIKLIRALRRCCPCSSATRSRERRSSRSSPRGRGPCRRRSCSTRCVPTWKPRRSTAPSKGS